MLFVVGDHVGHQADRVAVVLPVPVVDRPHRNPPVLGPRDRALRVSVVRQPLRGGFRIDGVDDVEVRLPLVAGSDRDAAGDWVDSLYLSVDSQLDLSDRLLARHPHVGGVVANDNYQETVFS